MDKKFDNPDNNLQPLSGDDLRRHIISYQEKLVRAGELAFTGLEEVNQKFLEIVVTGHGSRVDLNDPTIESNGEVFGHHKIVKTHAESVAAWASVRSQAFQQAKIGMEFLDHGYNISKIIDYVVESEKQAQQELEN